MVSDHSEPSAPRQLKAYLDTCLVSALVANDIAVAEQRALAEIFNRYHSGEVLLTCSPVVEAELAKIPSKFSRPHLELLAKFASVPKSEVGGLTRLGPAGFGGANPRHRLWRSLEKVLRDEQDAWHVLVASRNRIPYVVTVDQKTMLSRRRAVLEVSGVELVSPSEFVNVLDDNAR